MRYVGVDILRGVAAFFIIGCHLTLSPRTAAACAITHYCNMFVGVFAAVSGFLLARACSLEESGAPRQLIRSVMLKRCKRLLPTYILWSVFYVAVSFSFAYLQHDSSKLERITELGFWSSVIFLGGASCHLWFVISLLYASQAVLALALIAPNVVRSGPIMTALGAVLVFLSTRFGTAHFAIYDLRLLGFLATGVGIYGVGRNSFNSVEAFICSVVLIGTLIVHGLAPKGVVHSFVLDWFVAVPLVLLCSRGQGDSGLLRKSQKLVSSISSISFGVFLWHPLFAAVVCLIFKRCCAEPFDAVMLLSCWVVVALSAAIATGLTLRIKWLAWSVK